MNLIIDIGNTRTKAAIFSKGKIRKKVIWEKCNVKTVKAFTEKYNITNAALTSTANVSKRVEQFLQKNYFYLRLNFETKLPIQNKYKTPKTLGNDRLAAVVGAFDIFPNQNSLVIDAGTCITYDFIDSKGNYHGGSIAPGMTMRLKAMHAFTAKLPLVEKKPLKSFIGNNTETSLRTGGQMGIVMEIRGFIDAYNKTFGKINTILTGGDANFLAKHLDSSLIVNNNLVLSGLNKILNYNVQLFE